MTERDAADNHSRIPAVLSSFLGFLLPVIGIALLWIVWCAFPQISRPLGLGGFWTMGDATLTVDTSEAQTITAAELTAMAAEECEVPFLLRPLVDGPRNVTIEGRDASGNLIGAQKYPCGTNFQEE